MPRLSVITVLLFSLLSACAASDKSLLIRDGDELLDCGELEDELELAKNFGENASARIRHIRTLQKKSLCIPKPKISISIGVSGSL